MLTTYQGQLVAGDHRFAVVVARFNTPFAEQLLAGALDAFRRHGVPDERVEVAWVPGSVEIPLACQRFAQSGEVSAVVALGAVIRGATPHFDYVSNTVSRGCADVAMATGVPVSFGVLTTDTLEQALERAGTKSGNKGFDAALVALEMADLLNQLPAAASPA